MSGRDIGLVSCVKAKRDSAAAPKDLYTSTYFQKMRSYAEQNHDDWYILSAEHGLLVPDGAPIEPYDKTLRDFGKSARKDWAEQVAGDLDARGVLDGQTTLVFHAGKSYYQELLPLLKGGVSGIEIPTEGLQIGETLSWYNDHI